MRAMKDSGIPWIGEIPEGWHTCQVKNIFTIARGRVIPITEMDDSYHYPVYSSQTKDNGCMGYIPTFDYEGEALTWTTDGANAGTVFYRVGKFNCTNVCGVLQLKARTSFITYMLYSVGHSAFHCRRADTNGYKIMSNEMAEIKIAVPPLAEQQRIAEFLDRKCAEVDEMIALQEQIIEELKAYKQSVITEAVTKGLNPATPMKDSGIKWIRQIPYHWNIVAPKALFSQRKEKATEGQRQLTSSQQYGIIYQDEYCEITGNKVVAVIKDFDILKQVQAGDFVISMRSFQGGLEYSTKSGSISSAYVMLIPNLNYVYPRFYRWLFKSICYINALQSTSNMVRDGQAMRFANFVQVPLYQVPLKEQESIADFLDEKCADIDSLIQTKQSKIDSLKEYKKSIIYEYVTGKREVE